MERKIIKNELESDMSSKYFFRVCINIVLCHVYENNLQQKNLIEKVCFDNAENKNVC